MCPNNEAGERSRSVPQADGARKRAAIETYARHQSALLRTARRYSLCADDADDALQRSLEILLRKAPSNDPRELVRWTQTVVKREALAVRRERERILSGPTGCGEDGDWVALIPADSDGPPERAERREAIARSREALQALKPQELRALALLAEGYSYAEIGEMTGFSRTKINRCLAEGRERFRNLLSRSADGKRCLEMGPAISAFCDGETGADEAVVVREHLRACSQCRATMRAYRAVPAAAAALAPLPIGRSLTERAQDAFAALVTRLGGGATDPAVSQVAAAGGARGAGVAAFAKALAICAGTAGGAAACAATGVIPVPFAAEHHRAAAPLERRAPGEASAAAAVEYEPEPAPVVSPPQTSAPENPSLSPPPDPVSTPATASGSVEYMPPPTPAAAPTAAADPGSGDPVGEFGP